MSRNPRVPALRAYLDDNELIVDHFSGGGGASSGVARATGRDPDIAINHDAEAIAMHAANHPGTKHYISNIWDVDPVKACGGRPVGLLWTSPTCTHHSKARGAPLSEESVALRGLADVAIRWAEAVRPRIICLENVEEFEHWGPLDPVTFKVIRERRGELFQEWVGKLRALGYVVEWRLLRACDYGAPTTRRRLFLVARCDGRAIAWPEPTHARVATPRASRHRGAASCIDWSDLGTSIFDRKKPLADKTMARIARGVRKFVLESGSPFIVQTAHGGDSVGDNERRVSDVQKPLGAICAGGTSDALVVPYLVHRSNGERPATATAPGQLPRIYDVQQPLGTIMAQGQKHAVCTAFLVKHFGERVTGGFAGGSDVSRPAGAITAKDHHSLAAVHLVKFRGTSESHLDSSAQSAEDPCPTLTASGTHVAAVAAFLVRYNGQSEAQDVERPAGTLTTKDRYALVTVRIDGEEYYVADIHMRMLKARELFNCQDFAPDYVIDPIWNGKPLSKTAQVRMCGNSVPPVMAEVIARAQLQAAPAMPTAPSRRAA